MHRKKSQSLEALIFILSRRKQKNFLHRSEIERERRLLHIIPLETRAPPLWKMKRNPVDALIKRSARHAIIYKSFFPTNKHANPRNLRQASKQALNYILNSKVIKIIAPKVLYARAKWYNNNFGAAFLPNRISEFSTAPRARLAEQN